MGVQVINLNQKKMNKEYAKQKYKAGEIQICYDINNVELLREITMCMEHNGLLNEIYKIMDGESIAGSNDNYTPIKNLSEIEEEVIWYRKDMQTWNDGLKKWIDLDNCGDYKYRLKPKAGYTSEIESLQAKAKENGMRAIINFEKL